MSRNSYLEFCAEVERGKAEWVRKPDAHGMQVWDLVFRHRSRPKTDEPPVSNWVRAYDWEGKRLGEEPAVYYVPMWRPVWARALRKLGVRI